MLHHFARHSNRHRARLLLLLPWLALSSRSPLAASCIVWAARVHGASTPSICSPWQKTRYSGKWRILRTCPQTRVPRALTALRLSAHKTPACALRGLLMLSYAFGALCRCPFTALALIDRRPRTAAMLLISGAVHILSQAEILKMTISALLIPSADVPPFLPYISCLHNV